MHPLQYRQCPVQETCESPPCCPACPNPTYIGAYEWGGKSGIGQPGFAADADGELGSRFGTYAGFGPSTRPLNDIVYKGGFKDNLAALDRVGAVADTKLDLEQLTHLSGYFGDVKLLAMIGAWDARRAGSPLGTLPYRRMMAAMEEDARNGHLFLVLTGADGGGPVDVVVDEEIELPLHHRVVREVGVPDRRADP